MSPPPMGLDPGTRHAPPPERKGKGRGGADGLPEGLQSSAHRIPTQGAPDARTPICPTCGLGVSHLVPSYWGPYYCPVCCAELARDRDADGSWPLPWWEVPTPPHIAVIGEAGLWWKNRPHALVPEDIDELGRICERAGITQVWIHREAFRRLGFPDTIHTGSSGAGWVHRFTQTHGDWRGGRDPGLKAWAYWYKAGGHGFDLHIPHYGRAVWGTIGSAPELLARVAMFDRATGGVAWKGNGTITSDAYLRRRLRRVLRPTDLPPPVESGAALERPAIWTRAVDPAESRYRYCHALDLNMAYATGASSIPLPTGPYEHAEHPTFDPRRAGVYRYGTEWVTAPTAQRRTEAADEAYIWPAGGRHLRPWYEMLRDARAALVETGGPALTAVKDVCREGLGRMQSKVRTLPAGMELADDPTFQPYWAWAVIAEVRERLLARVAELDVEPIAIDTDCLFFLSSRPSPSAVAVALGLPLGDGLGHFKPAGTCLGREAREVLGAESRAPRALAQLRELVK